MAVSQKSKTAAQQDQRFKMEQKIGSGSFGVVFSGIDSQTTRKVAIKVEKIQESKQRLRYEFQMYRNLVGVPGIPAVIWIGVLKHPNDSYNTMVMELLGPSLEQLLKTCNGKFSLKTVLLVADQILERIEAVHSKSIIHQDIKPGNILMGTGDNESTVYLIDFGLAKFYEDRTTKVHIPFQQVAGFNGTAGFVSLNGHQGCEQSRRDDLEAIGFVLVYFLTGSLPWHLVKASTRKQKQDRMKEAKLSTSINEICKDCPNEFMMYLKYCRELKYEEKPDYVYCRKLFRDLFQCMNFQLDYLYDWKVKKEESEMATKKDVSPVKFKSV